MQIRSSGTCSRQAHRFSTRIAEAFGTAVIAPDGTLDRAALGAKVFGHADLLTRLNAIVHPAVREESQRPFQMPPSPTTRKPVVIYDVPLLVEARVDDPWDLIVVGALRLQRCVGSGSSTLRGMDENAAQEPDRRPGLR